MLAHSDSRMVFVEDGEQLAKIRSVEADCPQLEQIVVFDPGDAELGDALSLDALRERGRGRDAVRVGGPLQRRLARTTSASTSTPRARPGRPRAAC